MPFRLCNSQATFQRLMDIVMSGLNFETCRVYLDDIIVFSQNTQTAPRTAQATFPPSQRVERETETVEMSAPATSCRISRLRRQRRWRLHRRVEDPGHPGLEDTDIADSEPWLRRSVPILQTLCATFLRHRRAAPRTNTEGSTLRLDRALATALRRAQRGTRKC